MSVCREGREEKDLDFIVWVWSSIFFSALAVSVKGTLVLVIPLCI